MKICLLGASGSIGTQTLDVMKKAPKDFSLVGFSVGKQVNKVSRILKANPNVKAICVGNVDDANKLKKKYPKLKIFSGDEGLIKLIQVCKPQMVVNALVGFVGLKPTLFSLENDLKVALANKESLVVGGELINRLLNESKGALYPIDSEHSALWKCLKIDSDNIDKLYLTASGGAFRKLNRSELNNVTPEDALNHPTWKMGNKITIDCATMINKCFELIEAYYLYQYPFEKYGVTLHDESHVHSYIKYCDGSIRADVSKPDMRVPIKFALYQGNIPFKTYSVNSLEDFKEYHFHEFNVERYPLVSLAEKVIKEQGAYGAVLNASNEVAVRAFLNHEISFLTIEKIVFECMNKAMKINIVDYDDLYQIDKNTRKFAAQLVEQWRI